MITKTNDKLICHEQPFFTNRRPIIIWDEVFKNGPSEICSRQPLKNLKRYVLLKQTTPLQIF